jgi:CubicO group peptidase (beta-lactamase class C family)
MNDLIKNLELTAKASEFSGVISIFKENETLYHRAFGYRDVKNKLPNETTTKFGIASGTKVFTGLGIGKLIEGKKLSLNTKVSEIDKAFTGFISKDATILNLLTHTSGIYDYFDEEIVADFDHFFVDIPWYNLSTPLDFLPLFQNQTMKFSHNERFSYSNGGFVFLGIIIEMLSGKVYRDFLEAELLKPIGMTHSGFFAFNDLPENTANGYLSDYQTSNIYNLPIRGTADGGMYTTSEDLHLFWKNLFSQQILSKELTETFLATHHAFNKTSGYGCGVYKELDDSMFSIVGGDAGVGFDSRYLVEEAIVVNVLSNQTNGEETIREVVLDWHDLRKRNGR